MRSVFLVALLAIVGCSKDQPKPSVNIVSPAAATAPSNSNRLAAKTYPREEFKKLVIGKTKDEIIKVIGKPQRTFENSTRITWCYERTTYDPAATTYDNWANIYFKGDIADEVDF